MPNAYAWGSSNNTYSVNGETHKVTFNFAKPKDGGAITNIAIFPAQNNGLTNDKSKRGAEYYSGDDKMHQSFSGNYAFTKNQDGSATLTMSDLFRDGNLNGGAEAYAANRSIFVYVTKDGTTTVYKTNAFRAATLVPPKTSGSVVLKYNQPLTKEQIQAAITAAANAETARKDKKSVNDQIVAASTSKGVFTTVDGSSKQVPDTLNDKLNVKSDDAYDGKQFDAINTETSDKDAKNKTYVAGAKTLNTYMITDLGFKSGAIPLTVARYDTRIDKPIVDEVDFTKLTDDQKAEICKKLAQLNNVAQDNVKFNDQGQAVISFDGVDEKDAPKIDLKDLVLKNLKAGEYAVPSDAADSKVKPVIISNPLGFTKAEEAAIKKALYEANKDNPELGLSATDYEKQITLDWNRGNLQASGTDNQGISNGDCENTIHVTIKTDKAIAKFDSDVKHNKLTRLVNLRTDYTLSWDANKNKIDGRATDEGLAWMEDGKTLVYRYDSDSGTAFNTEAVLGLLKATIKEELKKDNPQMRAELLGSEYKTVAHEGQKGQTTRSHTGYAVDKDGNPIGVLNLSKLNGSSYGGFTKPVDNSDKKMGDEQASVGDFTFDAESKKVNVAGKTGKFMLGRLFIEPYSQYHYNNIYGEGQYNLRNSPKGINVVFVPQTKHKMKDLSDSIDEHKTTKVNNTDVPTESKYYNASGEKKETYDKALTNAKKLYDSVKNTDESKLTEQQKAQIDNATINLNKARAELDGDATKKEALKKSIEANGKVAEGQTAGVAGTVTTDRYKNVAKPSFLKDDGTPDTKKNEAASAAKTAYDEALAAAEKVNKDDNATQKDVDAAKAKLDAARKELDKYSTNKDKLNAAIAEHGQVKNGKNDQGTQDVTKADPTYQNSEEKERKAYDDAVKKANDLSKDPNASQKEVNEAITALEKAKKALDDKATNKAKLAAAIQQTFDNPDPADQNKQSTFYKNALAKKNSTDPNVTPEQKTAAGKAIDDYDQALAKAKEVLADKNGTATQAQVDDAVKKLSQAEDKLHEYFTDKNDLTKALADNIDGYLKPAYFNAFDKSLGTGADAEAAKKAFKEYNDAYHAAKDLKAKFANADPSKQPTDEECKAAKEALEQARQVIDTYATDTSKLSAAFWNDLAIHNSPAYKNAQALVDKKNPTDDEKAQVEAAKKIKKAYDDAVDKLHKAFSNTLDQDKDAQGTPFAKIPDAKGDPTSKNYLDGVQAHANGEPLNRDVDSILQEMNDAAKELNKFATKTDKLLESINKDTDTQKDPAYKNAKDPHNLGTDGLEDTSGYEDIKKKATAYANALAAAKALMIKPDATQDDVNTALKTLDEARKALDDYKTNVDELKKSVKAHGSTDGPAAEEGTVTSDAYRNASDPHFMKEEGGKLVPDTEKNTQAADAKKAYDKALAEAQELLKKAGTKSNTPLDAQPTQKQIDDAFTALNEKRKVLDAYKTDTTKLDEEAQKSQADGATAPTAGQFEDTPEFKNAKAKTSNGNENADVTAYKNALKKARDLVKASTSTDKNTKNSERPTQKQINDALDALTAAKKQIEDNYKTNLDALTSAKDFADGDFKKTPEYKNALAKKEAGDQTAKTDLGIENQQTGFDNVLSQIKQTLNDNNWKKTATQKSVNNLLKKLQAARDKISNNYKTDVKPLSNEVGDKDAKGKPVTPPFEASVAYKNALEKAKTESKEDAEKATSATKKLAAYNEKVKAAQKLIDQVNNPDQNAAADSKPTQKQVDDALAALKQAKKDLVDSFKTSAAALKKETKELKDDGNAKEDKDKFENSSEYQNALAKKGADGTSDNEDVAAYKAALKKANELLELFGEDGNPKANLPAGKQIPSQQEVNKALNTLKEIKAKILANYVTSPKDLQDEVDISVSGPTATGETAFEDTGAYQRALNDYTYDKNGKRVDNDKVARYKNALKAARDMLAKFDSDGKPKAGAPTQKELDAALAELKAAKEAITEIYTWMNYFPWDSWSTMIPQPEQKPGEPAPAPAPAPSAPAVSEPEDSLVAPASESSARVAPAHAPKHLAQTSDPTNGFAIATMLGSAFGFIVAGLKRKRNRR